MLIIRRDGSCAGGMKRYHGSGMFDAIGRKLFSSGIKKAITSSTSKAIAHKVADAAVSSAVSTSKILGDAVIKGAAFAAQNAASNAVNSAIDSVVERVKRKTEAPDPIVVPPPKRKKYIDSLVNGSGIVFD